MEMRVSLWKIKILKFNANSDNIVSKWFCVVFVCVLIDGSSPLLPSHLVVCGLCL